MTPLRFSLCILTLLFLPAFLPTFLITGESELEAWLKEQEKSGDALGISVQWQRGEESGELTLGRETVWGAEKDEEGDPVDGETRFEIGSITKVLTHLLLAESIGQGKVKDDTTIADLLGSDFAFAQPEVGKITLRELATHSSGLPRLPRNMVPVDALDPYKGFGDVALMNCLRDVRAKQPLRKGYAYSNLGVGLLGHLLGKVHGGDYRSTVIEQVLKPLEMTRSDFTDKDVMAGFQNGEPLPIWHIEDALAGAGGLYSCTDDLMRLGRWGLNTSSSQVSLKVDSPRMLEIVGEASGGFQITPVWHVATSEEGPIYFHNGATGAQRSFLGFRPDSGQVIALLVSSAAIDPTNIGLKWLGYTPREVKRPPVDTTLIGHYRLTDAVTIEIAEVGGTLTGQFTGQPAFVLEPISDDWYAFTVSDASLRFFRKDEKVIAFELVQFGIAQRAERMEKPPAGKGKNESILLSEKELDEYVGKYRLSGQLIFSIKRNGRTLDVQLTGQPAVPIYAREKDIFFYKVVEAEIHFYRDSVGGVGGLVLHQNGIKMEAKRWDPQDR